MPAVPVRQLELMREPTTAPAIAPARVSQLEHEMLLPAPESVLQAMLALEIYHTTKLGTAD